MNFLEGLRRIYTVIAVPIIIGVTAYWWNEASVRPYPFDVAAAKAEGYQEYEIANFLASTSGDDIGAVRAQGVTDAQAIEFLMKTSYLPIGRSYKYTGAELLREIPRKKSIVPKQAMYAAAGAVVSGSVLFGIWMIFQWIFTGFFPSKKVAK